MASVHQNLYRVGVFLALLLVRCQPLMNGNMGDSSEEGVDGGTADRNDGGRDTSILPVDCILDDKRKAEAGYQSDPRCGSVSWWEEGSIGSGISIGRLPGYSGSGGGFIEGERLILMVEAEKSLVFGIDLNTGNRTLLSGSYMGPNGKIDKGTGDLFSGAYDLQRGTDGWYTIAMEGAYRIDPVTGNRTRVWNSATRQCKKGGTDILVDFTRESLAIGKDNTIYLAFVSPGIGIAGIRAGACSVITLTGHPMGQDLGEGAAFTGYFFTGLRYANDAIWALHWSSKSLLRVDSATGRRTRVSSSAPETLVGAGESEIGRDWLAVGKDERIWTTGFNRPFLDVTSVDRNNGNRTGHKVEAGPLGYAHDPAAVWVHPKQPVLVMATDGGVLLYDPVRGDSNILSR